MKRRGLLLVLCLVFAGCMGGAPPSAPTQPVPPTFLASVETPDGRIGVTFDNNRLALYSVSIEGDVTTITTKQETGREPTVHLSTYSGDTGLSYNSFVFGLAPEGAARFLLKPAGEALGGNVANGTYVAALRARDVTPQQLVWSFTAGDGTVIESGSGIRD